MKVKKYSISEPYIEEFKSGYKKVYKDNYTLSAANAMFAGLPFYTEVASFKTKEELNTYIKNNKINLKEAMNRWKKWWKVKQLYYLLL